MADKDVSEVLSEKGADLKKMFKDMKAVLEQWKFSVEETKEGMRIEIHAVALVKRKEEK
ncbi:MAG: hypothetical protein LUO85_02215 [Methanomassiliicoccales archaeon]|jgi:hypothetical protein|nr:hypothetical protein [Methanomassiliicoccales archaeon]